MKSQPFVRKPGFTLLETVIAIGVLAVLITVFMYAFGPATSRIRRAINVQEADRLASTVERELANLRRGQETGDVKTGFDKAFLWIRESSSATNALFVYQYRCDPSKRRADATLEPVVKNDGVVGKDYIIQPMVRRLSDPLFAKDIEALEGPALIVKTTQLVFDKAKGLTEGSAGQIKDPQKGTPITKPDDFNEAVIPFSAKFYSMPANNASYFTSDMFKERFKILKDPVFTRNLAVRR